MLYYKITKYQGLKNFTWWLVHIPNLTVHGHFHLMWDISTLHRHFCLTWTFAPHMGHFHLTSMGMFTLCGHSHLAWTFSSCMEHFHLVWTFSPCIRHFHFVWAFPPYIGHSHLARGIFTLHGAISSYLDILTSCGAFSLPPSTSTT